MNDSNYTRTLRYAQRTRDRLVGDLRREGLTLCTSATVDYETAQRLHALARRVERIAAVLQVLEECTPEPESAAESEPVAPEPQGPRYAVEVPAGLDADEWRAGLADYAAGYRLDPGAPVDFTDGYRAAHAAIQRRLAGGDE